MREDWRWSMSMLGEDIHKTLQVDKDFTIAVSGFPGSGKSTFAYLLAKNVDENFDMRKQMIFTREDLINAANTLPPRSAIIIDEAVALLFRRDFMNTKQKEILKIMDMIRYKQYCLIFCVPSFWSLDTHLLQRVRLRIHIDRRGFGLIFKRNESPWATDPWMRKENEKICWNWEYKPDAGKAKGFIGCIEFGDMPDYAKKDYLPLKDEKKVLRETEEKKEKLSNKMVRILKHRQILVDKLVEMGINQTDVAKMLEVTQASISKIRSGDIESYSV